MRKLLYKLYTIFHSYFSYFKWKSYKANTKEIKIVIGASKTNFKGWFQTEQYFLDVTKPEQFERFFKEVKIDKILAEHVLEHLTDNALNIMLKNFYKYSSPTVNIRIAVPDGYHPSPSYIEQVKPMGSGIGAKDHKNLFTYKTLSALFETTGFKPHPVEYWDEDGVFHQGYVDGNNGFIKRSFINDARNRNGKPNYTSLIMDFSK